MIVLGAIADDITGATDLAALLARSGVPVVLHLGIPDTTPSARTIPDAPLQVIALKCRTAPVAEAVAECRAALAWLRAAGARRFYWKYCSTFDSTSQGNIGPVAEALMADLGTDQTIYCPAFPENGRSIFMGTLFVGEQPLAESPMKDHPLTPMHDSNLLRLLAPQVTRPVGLANRLVVAAGPAALHARLADLRAKGVAHVVVDAVADADLAITAEAARDLPLLTGGSALAMPLPALYRAAGLIDATARPAVIPTLPQGSIVLSGSCSAMTRAQVAAYLPQSEALQLDPLALAGGGSETGSLAAASAWLARQPAGAALMIYATAEPEAVRKSQAALGTARAGAVVEQALAALAVQVCAQGVRRLVIAGGETAGAVVNALGLRRLTIGPEIAPGVPWTFGDCGGTPLALALKSGNFGNAGFFADALRLLAPT